MFKLATLVHKKDTPTSGLETTLGGSAAGVSGSVAAGVGGGLLSRTFDLTDSNLTDSDISALRKELGVDKDIRIVKDIKTGPCYQPATRSVLTPNPHNFSTAHELGHASGALKNKFLSSLILAPYTPIVQAAMAGVRGAQGYSKGRAEALGIKDDSSSGSLGVAGNASKLLSAVQLLEEGQATARGLYGLGKVKGMRGVMGGLSKLLPAYGTYVLEVAGTHYAAPRIGEFLGKHREEFLNPERML